MFVVHHLLNCFARLRPPAPTPTVQLSQHHQLYYATSVSCAHEPSPDCNAISCAGCPLSQIWVTYDIQAGKNLTSFSDFSCSRFLHPVTKGHVILYGILWGLLYEWCIVIIHPNWLHLMLDWVHASHYLVSYDERLNEPHPEIFFKGTRSKFSRSPS